jgi:hypothetical protein
LRHQLAVAQIDESRSGAFAPKFKVEQLTIKSQSLLYVTNLERDVVETNRAPLLRFNHGSLLVDEKWRGAD